MIIPYAKCVPQTSSEVEVEEPTPEDKADADADTDADADEVEDDDADDAASPPAEKVKETVWDWKLLNENKAIWLRPPSEITEEEYTNFYKAVGKVCCLGWHTLHRTHLDDAHIDDAHINAHIVPDTH